MKSSHLEQKQSENWLEILAKNSSYKDKKFEHIWGISVHEKKNEDETTKKKKKSMLLSSSGKKE